MTPGVRQVGNRFQGYFGDAGPGKTRCFATEGEAAKWARQASLAWRNVGKRGGRRRLPDNAHAPDTARLPVGVTYSNGSWFARSPRWYPERVCRVFTVHSWGRELALKMALGVAKRWLTFAGATR